MKSTKYNPGRGLNILLYSITVIIAVLLKYHYSHADSIGLDWILRPTAWLVETITGLGFINEAHTGYVNLEHGIIIAPACAGINFLIIAFCMAVFTCSHNMSTHGQKVLCFLFSSFSSYCLAIGVNAIRIVISIHLFTADIYNSWFTPSRCHRMEGVFIYFFFLCLFYFFLRKIVIEYPKYKRSGYKILKRRQTAPPASALFISSGLTPLFWYLGITLIVPFANAAYKDNLSRFIEHGTTVFGVCMMVWGTILLLRVSGKKICPKLRRILSRIQGASKGAY